MATAPRRPGPANGGKSAAAARSGTRSPTIRSSTCVYIGTGNGVAVAPPAPQPGGGDNLFLCSIVALDADTGEYDWHYQERPARTGTTPATQPMILADLTIDGTTRKVLMQAPKNGFFYVIDRADGSFISAKNFVDVNWASGSRDRPAGRSRPQARAAQDHAPMHPGPSARTTGTRCRSTRRPVSSICRHRTCRSTSRDDLDLEVGHAIDRASRSSNLGWNTSVFVERQDACEQALRAAHRLGSGGAEGGLATGAHLALERRHAYERRQSRVPGHGGRTAGCLSCNYRREALVVRPVGTGIVAAPVTYLVDGQQYVSVAVGWGGVYGLSSRGADRIGPGRVYTYAIGAAAPLPEVAEYKPGRWSRASSTIPRTFRKASSCT